MHQFKSAVQNKRSWRVALTAAAVPTMLSVTLLAGVMPASAVTVSQPVTQSVAAEAPVVKSPPSYVYTTPDVSRPNGEPEGFTTNVINVLAGDGEEVPRWTGPVNVVSTLYGPFDAAPQAGLVVPEKAPVVGSVTTVVDAPGKDVPSEGLVMAAPGYYVWHDIVVDEEGKAVYAGKFGTSTDALGQDTSTTVLVSWKPVLTNTSFKTSDADGNVKTSVDLNAAAPGSAVEVKSSVTGPYATEKQASDPAQVAPEVSVVVTKVAVGADGRGNAAVAGLKTEADKGVYRVTHSTVDSPENRGAQSVGLVVLDAAKPSVTEEVVTPPADAAAPVDDAPAVLSAAVVPLAAAQPVSVTGATPMEENAPAADDPRYVCDEFETQQNAQNIYDLDREKYAYLDADGDNVACESNADVIKLPGTEASDAAAPSEESADAGTVPAKNVERVGIPESNYPRETTCETFGKDEVEPGVVKQFIETYPEEIDRLNGDNDKFVCDSEFPPNGVPINDEPEKPGDNPDTDLAYSASSDNNNVSMSLAGLGMIALGGAFFRRMKKVNA